MTKIEYLLQAKARVQLHLGGRIAIGGFVVLSDEKNVGVDITHKFEKYPYPLPNSSVDTIVAPNVIEHINPANKGFIKFMDEMWRILKTGGQFMIATPYAGSRWFYQDPCNINPCTEATFNYFDPMRSNGVLFSVYRPKPWKVVKIAWAQIGNMEVLLEKRLEDVSYK